MISELSCVMLDSNPYLTMWTFLQMGDPQVTMLVSILAMVIHDSFDLGVPP